MTITVGITTGDKPARVAVVEAAGINYEIVPPHTTRQFVVHQTRDIAIYEIQPGDADTVVGVGAEELHGRMVHAHRNAVDGIRQAS